MAARRVPHTPTQSDTDAVGPCTCECDCYKKRGHLAPKRPVQVGNEWQSYQPHHASCPSAGTCKCVISVCAIRNDTPNWAHMRNTGGLNGVARRLQF